MTEIPNREPENLPRAKSENFWIELLKTLGIAAILAVGLRQFVAEARFIPSGSMLPTLQIDDRLIVEKVSYLFGSPNRGDIVVFMPPDKANQICPTPPSADPTKKPQKEAFIKRVVGLPGEKVQVKEGRVYINDRPLREGYIEEEPRYNWGPQTIPNNSYLVLGDNRNNSCDSHFWGFVPRSNIIGRAVVRFWPPNRLGGLDEAASNN
ncbi:MAG: signal peptidase I [Cyanosarcina radialis HA8281-LM2]|jgi:signal peptidase I|nr:signal peptidase I [Cyanosarcina radialis HA8281-LM2]